MPASRTAEYVALYRALETTERRRPPLFRDPLAVRFLTGSRAVALRLANLPGCRGVLERYADSRAPGARTSAIGRTRFIDDIVRGELARGTRQLVPPHRVGLSRRALRRRELRARLGADEYRDRYSVGARGYAFYRVAVARVG